MTVFESLTGESIIGSGPTRTKGPQIKALACTAARRVETWLLDHPEGFGLPPLPPEPPRNPRGDK